ncbi:MarR family transcriptional regulator [Nocardiopsis tropica]|uniref:MarR family winged helix-turn-helix transcriptional regulator n=1 Tax=Tsukamurella strandjordii TaxID=147577 RepID=UPI0031DEA6A1
MVSVEQRLGYDIKATEVAFMSAKSAALRPIGLTVAQYATLLALRDNPGITGAGVARTCLVTPQAAAATLKTLEAKRLISRVQNDWSRSSRIAQLTEAGRDVVARADAAAGEIEQRMYDELTEVERNQLRGLLARCRASIGRE